MEPQGVRVACTSRALIGFSLPFFRDKWRPEVQMQTLMRGRRTWRGAGRWRTSRPRLPRLKGFTSFSLRYIDITRILPVTRFYLLLYILPITLFTYV